VVDDVDGEIAVPLVLPLFEVLGADQED